RMRGMAGVPSAFWVGVFVALLTSFYSWRVVFLTFYGQPRWVQSEHIQHAIHDAHDHGHEHHDAPAEEDAGHAPHARDHAPATGTGGYHPHESPWVMLIPLLLLSVGAIAAGFVFHGYFIEPEAGAHFWKGALAFNEHLMHEMHAVPLGVKLSATIAMLLGLGIAWYAYIKRPSFPAAFAAQFNVLYTFFLRKWYFDEIYNFLFVRPAFAIGRLLWKAGDEGTIDRFGPNGIARLVQYGSAGAARLQSGYLYTYAFIMLIGLTAALTWVIAG
ncbi:MAG: NADH-quinone oxidoreductase subunit L, partial [Sphingomonadales bacterium]